jgi:TRAP-type mannitol/chloroaromatic compound transport system permease small subunit
MFKKILQLYCVFVDKTVTWLGKGASFLVPFLAAVVFFGTIARYVFNAPPIWTFDTALFLFGYIAALGGAYAQKRRAHINVDIFYIRVPPKVKIVFDLISYSLGIFFLILVIYMSFAKFLEAWNLGYRRQSEWAPLMWHFWLMFSIASFFFALQLIKDEIIDIYRLITGQNLLESEQENGN